MITDKGLKLLSQIDGSQVDWRLALDCLQSSNLFEQAISFFVFTGKFRDEIVPKFPERVDVPMRLLEYFLNCIETDITPEQEYEYDDCVYTKGEAFLDLRTPMDSYWAKHDCELTEERFFQRIAIFLKSHPDTYFCELPTHVLEAWSPRYKPFSKTMKSWKEDPVLERYVVDLESILQREI